MKKMGCKKIKYLIKDEEKSAKEYKSYGYKGIAKDETRHAKVLKRRLKTCKMK